MVSIARDSQKGAASHMALQFSRLRDLFRAVHQETECINRCQSITPLLLRSMLLLHLISPSNPSHRNTPHINLLTSRILRLSISHHPSQGIILIPRIRQASLPASIGLRSRHWGANRIVKKARDHQLVPEEGHQRARLRGHEQGDRHVGGGVVGERHGRGVDEVPALENVGQEAGGADDGVGGLGGGVVELEGRDVFREAGGGA